MKNLQKILDDTSIIKVTKEASQYKVKILSPQVGSYIDLREFTTNWPEECLYELARLKGEWFYDSYQRFEHPNYVQKQVDFILDFHRISLINKRILDFGCGFGASSYCLIKRGANHIIATELDDNNIKFARKFFYTMGYSKFVEIREGNIVPTLEPNSFDIIWLQAVVEHLLPEERKEYLNKFWHALNPKGFLIITEVPNRIWPIELHTTGGKWFIPWMRPEKAFQLIKKNYHKFESYTETDFYRSGIIGSSYKEILRCLEYPSDLTDLSIKHKNYLKHLYSYARNKSFSKKIIINILNLFEPLALYIPRRPITAFMPFLNHLAFQKN